MNWSWPSIRLQLGRTMACCATILSQSMKSVVCRWRKSARSSCSRLSRNGPEKAAIIVTNNQPFSEWTQVIPNARLCKALIDRIHGKQIAVLLART